LWGTISTTSVFNEHDQSSRSDFRLKISHTISSTTKTAMTMYAIPDIEADKSTPFQSSRFDRRFTIPHANRRATKIIKTSSMPPSISIDPPAYSHSIVEGGLLEISNTTRLMPLTSLQMRLLILARISCGGSIQLAVMPSMDSTILKAAVAS